MNSSYYYNLMLKYQDIMGILQNKVSYFDSAIGKLNYANMFFLNQENMMMSGNQLDEGKINELAQNLERARANIVSIIDECSEKIIINRELYQQAYARELTAKEEKFSEK